MSSLCHWFLAQIYPKSLTDNYFITLSGHEVWKTNAPSSRLGLSVQHSSSNMDSLPLHKFRWENNILLLDKIAPFITMTRSTEDRITNPCCCIRLMASNTTLYQLMAGIVSLGCNTYLLNFVIWLKNSVFLEVFFFNMTPFLGRNQEIRARWMLPVTKWRTYRYIYVETQTPAPVVL